MFFSPCLLLLTLTCTEHQLNKKKLHKECKNIYKKNYNLDLKSLKNVRFLVRHAHTSPPTHTQGGEKKMYPHELKAPFFTSYKHIFQIKYDFNK